MQRPFGWFGGAALASLAAWGFNLQRFRRYGPHSCSKCGTRLKLLSEQEEDSKLTPVQQLEEKIGSINYDVWFCPACLNNDTERYIRAFSHFKDCPQCKARTFKEDPQKIVRPATSFFSGLAEVEGRCVNCNYKTVRKIVLPMLASSGWSGGGSSGSGSFGGSFGGGRWVWRRRRLRWRFQRRRWRRRRLVVCTSQSRPPSSAASSSSGIY